MFKINKKGFALVETLIVTVFVATIFTIMYTNFFPMFGEYERRENYDDIDSIYRTYLIKKMLENPNIGQKSLYENYKSRLSSGEYYIKLLSVDYTTNDDQTSKLNSDCWYLTNTYGNYCVNVLSEVKAVSIYLTPYNIKNVKQAIKGGNISESAMDSQMQDYVDSLPYYKNNSSGCNYRIIVEYAKEINKESENHKKVIYSFSTIGVKL